ncbi:cytochrome c biogenesis factor [Owenweeksia hongkongensis DSM 17368]|uniref:Cytochrome c biogenesis factor n=1 Tax=Owenweeksia hongkongensis (strain DSM 17368 / CIP 108786 / JCM 12287 / NRRL B-23963 / UST20020801) TaxID=926562 RepID=G8R6S1_OWEHD|nr:cytochrome c biogenesis protein CcsA [Owenweeksia hongkongensis]AEV31214.1 cytochrome c biogenesis factor [Owenweeksia hongkongensis DSM 17368]
MEYVGEHLLPGQLGRLFVSLAFVGAVVAAIAYYFFIQNKQNSFKKLARVSFLVHVGSVFGIVLTLFYLLLSHYFEYDYVWKHSSMELPFKYVFSAFWEGQEGSFILWLFWHAVLGTILMFTAKKWEAPAMIVFALVQAFLASMILGIYPFGLKIGSSPFVLMRNVPENIGLPWTEVSDYLLRFPGFMDGTGLNPLLQNYWMTIHPPTLFLGFASTLVPFAFAMAALFNKEYKGWVKPAIPWAYFSVLILGVGILMGGAWAYEALSFGGFWAWDPVENSSLVPWIVMVGAAHLLLIVKNRKTGLTSAFFMTLLSFLLILYSTFLTRSGVLGDSSVHAFVDLGLSGQLLIYLLFFIVIAFGMFFYRYKGIPKSKKDDELSSREFWMFIGSLVLLIAAFQIIFSTSIPVINQLIGPEGLVPMMSDKMAPPLDAIDHYNSFQVPFSIVIALLIAFGQFLNYRHTSAKKFWKNISLSILVGAGITALFATAYDFWQEPLYLILLFTGIFATVSNIDYWLRIGRGNMSIGGASIAHVGFAMILIGSLISNAKKEVISETNVFLSEDLPSNENALLELADTVKLGQYMAIWNGMRDEDNKQFYDVTYYDTQADGSLKETFALEPFLQMSDQMGPTPNPSTKHYWNKDIYTHVTYSSYLEPRTDDGYSGEVEAEFNRGDTVIYEQHFIVMDSLQVNAAMNEETGEMAFLKLTAKMRIINVLGETYEVAPEYILDGNMLSHEDVYMEQQGFKIRFSDVNTENNKIKITLWTKVPEDEKPFIVMKAIVFPLINLLWAGCILMAFGTGIAIWQRVKREK